MRNSKNSVRQSSLVTRRSEIRFPLGGIGTGSVSLTEEGALVDWEIFNRPNKGTVMPFSFFSLWTRVGSQAPSCRVLQGASMQDFIEGGDGDEDNRRRGAGLPLMRSWSFNGSYPFASIDFRDPAVPLKVRMEAYNPFIPLEPDDSGIPAAVFHFHLTNPTRQTVEATLAGNLFNPIGVLDRGFGKFSRHGYGQNVNAFRQGERVAGLSLTSQKYGPEHARHGSLALVTPWKALTWQSCWVRGPWWDNLQHFWDEFSQHGVLQERAYPPSEDKRTDIGTLGLRVTLKPGETAILPVYLCWSFPNFEKYWGEQLPAKLGETPQKPTWKNYYAHRFPDAWTVGEYLGKEEPRLRQDTRTFHDTLHRSTLPPYVLDALSSQASILKTTTCLRLTDGTFYAFEGCHPGNGCCEGSCTHVWNYAHTLAFLFPSLERTLRESDYQYNLVAGGKMGFRTSLPLGSGISKFPHAAADGQMGGIMKTYRDWKLSGNNAWLASLWPKVKQALEYAWEEWDKNQDGVMEGVQHNTYDIEFHGPNTMMGSWYLGALKAGAEMARQAGDEASAGKYEAVAASGQRWMDHHLFNGEWYVQQVDDPNKEKYQYGLGCLADQLIGQWFAHLTGLGHLLDPAKVRQTMRSIFKYNFKTDFWDHPNCQRIYAWGDEQGLLLCTWPKGGRPALPFVYSDEVWCGIEYQVASHLIYEGLVKEGLAIVKGVRDRHTGVRRNPWNEFECGNHYARSMASWSVLTALSGFSFDAPRQRYGFAPALTPNRFTSFWSTDSGWGLYSQRRKKGSLELSMEVVRGRLAIKELLLPPTKERRSAKPKVRALLGSAPVNVSLEREGERNAARLSEAVTITPGRSLTVTIG